MDSLQNKLLDHVMKVSTEEDHQLFQEKDFSKNSKRFGREFLNYLADSFACLGGMTEEEWRIYNGVPSFMIDKIKEKSLKIEIRVMTYEQATNQQTPATSGPP